MLMFCFYWCLAGWYQHQLESSPLLINHNPVIWYPPSTETLHIKYAQTCWHWNNLYFQLLDRTIGKNISIPNCFWSLPIKEGRRQFLKQLFQSSTSITIILSLLRFYFISLKSPTKI